MLWSLTIRQTISLATVSFAKIQMKHFVVQQLSISETLTSKTWNENVYTYDEFYYANADLARHSFEVLF
jgi:hypothetical protein